MPGYLRQSEEDLPEAEGQFLGLPDGSIDTDPCHPQPARPRLRQGLSPPLMAQGYPFGQDAMDGPYAVTSTLVVRPITRRSSHGEPAASHSGNGGLRVAHARPLVCFNSAADSPPVGCRQAVANPCDPSHENAVRRWGPPPFQSNLNRYAAQNRNTRIGDWKA